MSVVDAGFLKVALPELEPSWRLNLTEWWIESDTANGENDLPALFQVVDAAVTANRDDRDCQRKW